jgi:hypothetical protein
MLNYAADWWPLLWLILGGAALVTAALCLLVATFSPAWFRPRRQHQPALTAAEQAEPDHQGRREAKAA